MVLEDAKQKELGVVWMMEVLRVRVEAEAEVDLVERLAETEVNLSKPIYISWLFLICGIESKYTYDRFCPIKYRKNNGRLCAFVVTYYQPHTKKQKVITSC